MALHTEPCDAERAAMEAERRALPRALPLSAQSLEADGVYLLHTGTSQFVHIGPQCAPEVAEALFGAARPSPAALSELRRVPPHDTDPNDSSAPPVARRAADIVERLDRRYAYRTPRFAVTWRGSGRREALLLTYMVDDAAPHSAPYVEWLVQLHRLINAKLQ